MTREEEITREAKIFYASSDDYTFYNKGFEEGAKWADQNPRKGLWDAQKVIKFIKENVREYHKSGVFHIDDFIKDLAKAIEG